MEIIKIVRAGVEGISYNYHILKYKIIYIGIRGNMYI
jgi:hypothetical protein